MFKSGRTGVVWIRRQRDRETERKRKRDREKERKREREMEKAGKRESKNEEIEMNGKKKK